MGMILLFFTTAGHIFLSRGWYTMRLNPYSNFINFGQHFGLRVKTKKGNEFKIVTDAFYK